jgi:hypothetical protein
MTTKGGLVSKKDDKRIAALAKKNAAKSKAEPKDRTTQYDSTLRIRPADQDPETRRFFKEMKKREF